jgi:hypothetical protein
LNCAGASAEQVAGRSRHALTEATIVRFERVIENAFRAHGWSSGEQGGHRHAATADAVTTIFLAISRASLTWPRIYMKMLAFIGQGV